MSATKCFGCGTSMPYDTCFCEECLPDVTSEMQNRCVPGELMVLAYVHPIDDSDPYWVSWSESGHAMEGLRKFSDPMAAVTDGANSGANTQDSK